MDDFNTKRRKIHLKHEHSGNFDTSMVEPLDILVYLVRKQIVQVSSESGLFVGRPSMSPLFSISFIL